MSERRLLFSDVREGDELPRLTHEVTSSTVVLGALASRDWRPMHHDYHFATERNGTKDIFLNTPNQAAWFERYLTDWTGPKGRLGRLKFRMKRLRVPRRHHGAARGRDERGPGRHRLRLGRTRRDACASAGEIATTCEARVALPVSDDDNPWTRRADAWRP